MRKFWFMMVVCLMAMSCTNNKFESLASDTMKATIREATKLPETLKLSNEKVVYCDDSLCIIHIDFSAKNLMGLDVNEKIEYVFVKSNGGYFEAYHSIDDEAPIYLSESDYQIIKENKIYEKLNYKEGLRYLSSKLVISEGRGVGNNLNKIIIPGNTGAWEKMQFTNEFKEKTEKSYLVIDGNGFFSNSATYESDLYALLFYQNDSSFYLKLFEYGDNLVRDGGDYKVKIKDSNGNVYVMEWFNSRNSGIFLSMEDEDNDTMRKILEKGGTLTFSVKEIPSNRYVTPSEYFFTLNTDGFIEAFKTLKE